VERGWELSGGGEREGEGWERVVVLIEVAIRGVGSQESGREALRRSRGLERCWSSPRMSLEKEALKLELSKQRFRSSEAWSGRSHNISGFPLAR